MQSYVALLRGVNVGGNNIIKMSELQSALLAAGFVNARTFIQSGNFVFQSSESTNDKLAQNITAVIQKQFGLSVDTAVFDRPTWRKIIAEAPGWWGKDTEWKHNLLVMVGTSDIDALIGGIGALKPGIEKLQAGRGVLYQSVSLEGQGRAATGSKLTGRPVYKQLTIRNFNTAQKLLVLLNELD